MLCRFRNFSMTSPLALILARYLANWKMLEPRKLMPFSIEYCNAPIAVITEITEKTPMVMPSIVSAERSLFAPSEAAAILIISRNNMSILRRKFHHRDHREHRVTMRLHSVARELCGGCHASVRAR